MRTKKLSVYCDTDSFVDFPEAIRTIKKELYVDQIDGLNHSAIYNNNSILLVTLHGYAVNWNARGPIPK